MTSTYFLNNVMGNVFKTKTSPVLPTKFYLGLSSTAPNLDGTGVTEPLVSANYSRVELTTLGQPVNGVITNTSEISFPESSSSWGIMGYFVLYDSQVNGNLLMYEQLSSPRSVEPNTIVMVKNGNLKLALSNVAS